MKIQRWICIQDQNNGREWFYEPSLSYTRQESIRLLLDVSSDTWRQLKAKYYWRCSKVELSITEVGDLKNEQSSENTILSYHQALNAIAQAKSMGVIKAIVRETLKINK